MKVEYIYILFALMLVSGFWLSRKGKPYNVIIQTIHKLISVGGIGYVGVLVYRLNQSDPIGVGLFALFITALIFFLGLVATGGLLATEKQMPAFVLLGHKIFPYLAIFSAVVVLLLTR